MSRVFPLEHVINSIKEDIITSFQDLKDERTFQGCMEVGFGLYVLERVLFEYYDWCTCDQEIENQEELLSAHIGKEV